MSNKYGLGKLICRPFEEPFVVFQKKENTPVLYNAQIPDSVAAASDADSAADVDNLVNFKYSAVFPQNLYGQHYAFLGHLNDYVNK